MLTIGARKESAASLNVIGLDISTKVGFAHITASSHGGFKTNDIKTLKYTGKETGVSVVRAGTIAKLVLEEVVLINPDVVMIEDYSYGSKFNLATMVTIGALVRYELHNASIPYLVASPGAIKKFVTGKGSAKKDSMMKEAYKSWGVEGTDDEIDAFGVALIPIYAIMPSLFSNSKAARKDAVLAWATINKEAVVRLKSRIGLGRGPVA